jgi:hypothetical protein
VVHTAAVDSAWISFRIFFFAPAGPHRVRSARRDFASRMMDDDFIFIFNGLTGAPGEIRTPDPQIRSRDGRFDTQENSCKPALNGPVAHQRLKQGVANRRDGPPDPKTETPAAPASANEGNSKSFSKRFPTTRDAAPQAFRGRRREDVALVRAWGRSIYAEQEQVGTVHPIDCGWLAEDADGYLIGIFAEELIAVRAVLDGRGWS